MKANLLILLSLYSFTIANAQKTHEKIAVDSFEKAPTFFGHMELLAGFGTFITSDISTEAPKFNLTGSLKVLYNFDKIQLGISVTPMQIYTWGAYTDSVFNQYRRTDFPFADPALPICVEINKKTRHKNPEINYGLAVGYVHVFNGRKTIPYKEERFFSGNGFNAGAHISGTYFISKNLGISAELACNYMHLSIGNIPYQIIVVPFVLSFRYKI